MKSFGGRTWANAIWTLAVKALPVNNGRVAAAAKYITREKLFRKAYCTEMTKRFKCFIL